MQIYSKSQKMPLHLSTDFYLGLLYLVELSLVHQTSTQNLEILLHMLIIVIYAN